jgi:hypothetical protein
MSQNYGGVGNVILSSPQKMFFLQRNYLTTLTTNFPLERFIQFYNKIICFFIFSIEKILKYRSLMSRSLNNHMPLQLKERVCT